MNIYRSMSCEVCKYSWLKLQGISKYHFWPPNWWCSFWSTAKCSSASVQAIVFKFFSFKDRPCFQNKLKGETKFLSVDQTQSNPMLCYNNPAWPLELTGKLTCVPLWLTWWCVVAVEVAVPLWIICLDAPKIDSKSSHKWRRAWVRKISSSKGCGGLTTTDFLDKHP